MPAQVAVAVVSWNTRELLARCLESLRHTADSGLVEVWVVDNASTDGSAAMVADRFGWVRLIEAGANLGFGGAVNLVGERTSTPWLAPANADVELDPRALDALLAAGRDDERAGILAPRLLLPDGSTQHSVHPFPTVPVTLAFNLGLATLWPRLGDRLMLVDHWDPRRPRRVDWAIGAFLLVRRAAWDAAGGFDADQWMYAEDLDLGWRASRAGWRTRYVPAAVVRHHDSAAARQMWDDRSAQWQRATYAWMLRRRGRVRTRAIALINVAGAAVRALRLAPAARRRGGLAAERHAQYRYWVGLHRIGLEPRARLSRQAGRRSP